MTAKTQITVPGGHASTLQNVISQVGSSASRLVTTQPSMASFGRQLVIVNSFSKEVIEKIIVPKPDVGIRWGKPAALKFDAPPSLDNGLDNFNFGDEEDKEEDPKTNINGTETHRDVTEHQFSNPMSNYNDQVSVEGFTSISFKTGERIEWREKERKGDFIIDIYKVRINEFYQINVPTGGTSTESRGEKPVDTTKDKDK